jgi:nucleoside-diphosphate-sugar epimerase
MGKVAIIGGSGFIGSYITQKFLAKNFKVKVSATDLTKKEKYQHLMNLANADNLEISSLNTQDITALKTFIRDCEILIHCGTPFQLEVEDVQKELFDPTIQGTENLLKVISETSTVKKVVFIASVAAYNAAFPFPADSQSPDHLYTEKDTPSIHESNHPYAQAKHYADQAVRKFVKDYPDIEFEIVSVFPTFVVGKPLSDRQDSTSVGLQFLIKNKLTPNPFIEMLFQQDVEFALVDVNDVADSVFKAATINELHGKNYLLSSESWKMSDISLMLNKQQPEGESRIVYSSELATKDLGVKFNPARIPLSQFG